MHKVLISFYECALAVENDEVLKADLAAWDVTLDDGLKEDLSKSKTDVPR